MERSDRGTLSSVFEVVEGLCKSSYRLKKRIERRKVGQTFLFPNDQEVEYLIVHANEIELKLDLVKRAIQELVNDS